MTDRGPNGATLILGAGPAGMACAMELHRAGRRFTLVEKQDQVGGLARTYRFGDFRTDNGPHRFFSKNPYLYAFIGGLLGERWITVDRFTRFYIGGKYYRYPVQWRDALGKMGALKAARALADYASARVRYAGRTPASFEEFALQNFGRSLAEFNVLNYTEKIWGLPCSELSVDWARQRIQDLSIRSLLANTLLKRAGPKTLVDQFYYPESGTGLIYETIRGRIERDNPVLLNTQPVAVRHDGGRVREVALSTGETLRPEHVVSSVPITTLVGLLDPAPPEPVMAAARSLRFRSQVYLFLTIDKPSVSPDQWIYFPDREIPFGRISEMRNFSASMSPPGKTSLFIEFFCWKDDPVWNQTREALFDRTIAWLERLGLVTRAEVMEIHHLRREDAYPVYDMGYRAHLDTIKAYLDRLENLRYIGRPGRFRYTNQDHSLEMGILAARSIHDGERYDLETVAADPRYFEEGKLHKRTEAS